MASSTMLPGLFLSCLLLLACGQASASRLTAAAKTARFVLDDAAQLPELLQFNASDRPLIGIYTQDSPSDYAGIPGTNAEYIAASYAKLVEGSGARPVAVSYNLAQNDLLALLDALDGFIFPGGGQDLSLDKTYATNALHILNYAQDRIGFPVVGICLGFELLSVITAQQGDVLSSFDAQNLLDKPSWEYQAYLNSKLSQFYPPYSVMQAYKVFENHRSGVSLDTYQSTLSGFFSLLATSLDRNNDTYVSAMEARDYPIFGFQFHPEKNTYEWKDSEVIPHDFDDLEITRGLQKLLGYYTRQSQFGRESREWAGGRSATTAEDVNKMLIYNTPVVFTAPYSDKTSFEQIYFFPKGYNPMSAEA